MKQILTLLLALSFIPAFGQQRLELLETNISADKFSNYGDSYLWTKNWWLTNKIVVDVSKGGNAISKDSRLTKGIIDSLSTEFSKFISPDIVRFGGMKPRLKFTSEKKRSYIKASIYEINDQSVKLIGQFLIEFGSDQHNEMPDVYSIKIYDPTTAEALPDVSVMKWLSKPATTLEKSITPPDIGN